MNAFAHPGGVTGCAVSGGAGLVSVGQDKVLKRWRADAPGPVRVLAGHTGAVHAAVFLTGRQPDRVGGGNWPEGDKTVRVWDTATGQEALKIDLPTQVAMVTFSPNGKFVPGRGRRPQFLPSRRHHRPEGAQVPGHADAVHGVAFSHDGKHVLTCGADKTARLWDTETAKELKPFTGHHGAGTPGGVPPGRAPRCPPGGTVWCGCGELDTAKKYVSSRVRELGRLPFRLTGRKVRGGRREGNEGDEVETGRLVHTLDGHPYASPP